MPQARVPVDPALLEHWAMARWESDAMMYLLGLAYEPVNTHEPGEVVHVDAPVPRRRWERLVHHRARRLLEEVGGMSGPGFEIVAAPQ